MENQYEKFPPLTFSILHKRAEITVTEEGYRYYLAYPDGTKKILRNYPPSFEMAGWTLRKNIGDEDDKELAEELGGLIEGNE